MDESTLPTPLYFFHNYRPLRALLLDDQVWFVLDDLRRLIGHPSNERLSKRLEDDQLCTQWLRLDDVGSLERVLVSESGAYALVFHFAHADLGGLRRWISTRVVPEVRGQGGGDGPRQLCLSWGRCGVRVLDWQGQLWVDMAELPRLVRGSAEARVGWREWARRLR
ncbi:phage antirepressor [Pseudomonas sp. 273]|uniref:BRO-N domain-containing protein n=1 Tax=Pseudomonas sp. 273 TaxID=75692 RepID=UPI0023D8572F|nr:phage antirepressor [Pseudomonas sp. 273]